MNDKKFSKDKRKYKKRLREIDHLPPSIQDISNVLKRPGLDTISSPPDRSLEEIERQLQSCDWKERLKAVPLLRSFGRKTEHALQLAFNDEYVRMRVAYVLRQVHIKETSSWNRHFM